MRFIDVPNLQDLTNVLSTMNCGDQKLDARIELYSCDRQSPQGSPGSRRNSSPSTYLSNPRCITEMMKQILSETYPEYQFNQLRSSQFVKQSYSSSVINAVNQTLGCVVERSHPGLLDEIWQILRELIDLPACDIYELTQDALNESRLWSFYLFWHDKVHSKVLFFSCRSQSRWFHSSAGSDMDSRASSNWSRSSSRVDMGGMSNSEEEFV